MRLILSLLIIFMLAGPVWAKPYVEIVGADKTTKARYDVEIADDDDERRTGLMDREKLDIDTGMLFIFDPPQHATFWMMNTYISLDMIFANKEGSIIHIEKDVQPQDLTSRGPKTDNVAYVLEVNAGQSEKNAIEIGDRLAISK